MEMDENPLLVNKIAEIVRMGIDEAVLRPIEEIVRHSKDHGVDAVLTDSEMGCEANAHHSLN